MDKPKHIVVLGAGLSGLSAARDLLNNGYRVTIIEATPQLGGLASSFQLKGFQVERFYHFLCRSDHDLITFVKELGLEERLHWRQNHTAFFHNGRQYSFGTPFDLLRFQAVPWDQRFRFGLHILQSRLRSQWRWLDQIPAKPWLIENIGEQAYYVIWHPLLKIKFGQFHEKISSAWVWHRIWRVAQSRKWIWQRESFGYLEHGSSTLISRLANLINAHSTSRIITNTPAQSIQTEGDRVVSVLTQQGKIECDAVISTIALPELTKILPADRMSCMPNISQVQYIGVVCAILSLKHSFSRNFWMNINDPSISFNGIIEQSNLNHSLKSANMNLIYIPFYMPTDSARFSTNGDQILAEYLPMLKRINPSFEEGWIEDFAVFKTPHAQAICSTGFKEIIPEIRTPVSGLYLTDSAQFYPEDRTISAAVRQGRRAASLVMDEMNGFHRNRL